MSTATVPGEYCHVFVSVLLFAATFAATCFCQVLFAGVTPILYTSILSIYTMTVTEEGKLHHNIGWFFYQVIDPLSVPKVSG